MFSYTFPPEKILIRILTFRQSILSFDPDPDNIRFFFLPQDSWHERMMPSTRYQIPSSFLLYCDIDKYHDDNCVRDGKNNEWKYLTRSPKLMSRQFFITSCYECFARHLHYHLDDCNIVPMTSVIWRDCTFQDHNLSLSWSSKVHLGPFRIERIY